MSRIVFHNSGDFRKTNTWLRKLLRHDPRSIMKRYGELGVQRLQEATPKRTGRTAASWSYDIRVRSGSYSLIWTNSNIAENGTPVVILLQYGHGTRGGTYVQGRDFINPAVLPVLEELGNQMWEEVRNLG